MYQTSEIDLIKLLHQKQYSIHQVMLTFSNEDIVFNYKANSHLVSALTIKNNTPKFVYYKFKVSRQKFFMVKPDRGLIKPNSQIQIAFTLHKEGIQDSGDDRFQLTTVFQEREKSTDINTIFKQATEPQGNKKFLVRVNGAGNLIKSTVPQKNILYNSINTKDFQSIKKNLGQDNLTFEALIQKKEKRIGQLQKQIQSLQTEKLPVTNSSEKTKSSKLNTVIVSIVGLVIGVLLGNFI